MRQISDIIECNIVNNTKCSILTLGPAGVGKSMIVNQLAKKHNLPVIEKRLGYLTPGEMIGTPDIVPHEILDMRVTDYAIPKWLADTLVMSDNGGGILLLDEFTNAAPDVLGVSYELLLDRKINNIEIPDNIRILGLGNHAVDAMGIASELSSTILTRALILDVTIGDVDSDFWLEWAETANINPHITSFIRTNPHCLISSPVSETSYATPRTWELMSKQLDAFLPNVRSDSLSIADSSIRRVITSIIPEHSLLFAEQVINNFKTLPAIQYIQDPSLFHRKDNCFYFVADKICNYIFKQLESNKLTSDNMLSIEEFIKSQDNITHSYFGTRMMSYKYNNVILPNNLRLCNATKAKTYNRGETYAGAF